MSNAQNVRGPLFESLELKGSYKSLWIINVSEAEIHLGYVFSSVCVFLIIYDDGFYAGHHPL